MSQKILFVSAEVAPFAKIGGLADVAGSLPRALHEAGFDVRVVMPAYRAIESGWPDVAAMPLRLRVPVRDGDVEAGVFEGRLPGSEVPVYFIAEQHLFNRPRIYGYDDDPYRFAFFSRAAIALIEAVEWWPDVLHAHDWHTAAAIFWLATAGQADERLSRIATIFTIHNLAHQGRVSWDLAHYLRIWTHSLSEEPYGALNLMARGIYHAGHVTTVSPSYAMEIQTREGGAGLDGLLRHRRNELSGIVNGLDVEEWNPASDVRLPHHFSADALDQRLLVRHALQDAVGLPRRDDIPLVGLVSRLDYQKGLDITGEVVHRLLRGWAGEAQFVVLGSGAEQYEQMFRDFAHNHPHQARAILEFRAELAPLIYGGSDIFLMPSLFEPCGLGQLIAMRYGCVPVVRATGGLLDTVWDGVTGFMFQEYNAEAFWEGLARAIYVYNVDRPRWHGIMRTGMEQDFSWGKSAEAYAALYRRLTK
jgi:starch synthase